MFFKQYLSSLSHQDAILLTSTLLNTFLVLTVSVLGYIGYEFYENQQEKKKVIEWESRENLKSLDTIEHVVYEHGTQEYEIEIHHYTNPSKAEFIRHLKDLNCKNISFPEFKVQIEKLIHCMKLQQHINADDVKHAAYIILHSNQYDTWISNMAYMWINIAKTYWIMNPNEEMLPFQIDFIMDMYAEEREMRSKSF